MNAKHTTEPWKLIDEARNEHYRAKRKSDYEKKMQHCWYLCGPGHESHFIADIITSSCSTGAANASRIVTCVNACSGLNPEAVPELLQALQGLMPLNETNAGQQYASEFLAAQNAIDLAKGEPA